MGANFIPKRDENGNPIYGREPFGSKIGRKFRGVGIEKECPVNTQTEISYTIQSTFEMSGVEVLNANLGDFIQMQVRDDENGTYSGYPNAVLDQFGTDWYVRPSVFQKELPYTAKLFPNMKVVFIYTNTDLVDSRTIYINLDLHEVV